MSNKRPVSLNLPEDLLAAIDDRAAADGRSRSGWLVHFLQQHGVNPHAVKDGPYNSELALDGRRLVDLPEGDRFTVRIGERTRSNTYPWLCVELPDVRGSVARLEDVQPDARNALEEHLGRSVAVYLDGR
jgi:hypothetical protein